MTLDASGTLISDAYRQGGRMLNEHHYAIFEAIKAKDAPRAREAVRRDILEGSKAVLAVSKPKTVKAGRA